MSSSRWRRPIPPATRHGSTVPLLDAEPDLNRYLTAEQRIDASRVALPVHTVTRDSRDVDTLLATANAFGVLVLGGLLERRIRVDDHATLRLLGPGDLYL